MKEINIHKIIADKRKERDYAGRVSGVYRYYEGVCFQMGDGAELSGYYILPLLASYFNISIDELICYTPQMEPEDIRDLYHRLAEAFSENHLMK